MFRLNIRALSLNSAYRGRRFATKELKEYKEALFRMLPRKSVPEGKLSVRFVFGVSSKASDVDNLVKNVMDALAEAYGFNDNRVYKLTVEKKDVPKSQEYIEFEITAYNDTTHVPGHI